MSVSINTSKGLSIRNWVSLLLFAGAVHFVYAGFVFTATGSLAAKRTVETVLTALKLDNVAKFLTPSVLDMAFEQVVENHVQDQIVAQRALAAERPHVPMPEVYRTYKGRGLLSDDEVIDVSTMETQVRNLNFGVVPEAVEFPEEIDKAKGTPETPPPSAPLKME